MEKTTIRARILRQRRQLPPEVAAALGTQAQQRLIASGIFSAARSVALYCPIHNEVATEALFAAAIAAGKQVSFPRVRNAALEFAVVDRIGELQPGSFGIYEPGPAAAVTGAIDLMVVPGVAFDRRGHRLGYGRGYYDRYLVAAGAPMAKVGLCYSFQLHDRLPDDQHDQELDWLVTEHAVISCHAT
ncbi:MAG: 5-formyltetrahydrofolate cyclo-ligase [Pelovirga sp.]